MVSTSPLGRVVILAASVALASASLTVIPTMAQAEPEPAADPAAGPAAESTSQAWPATPLPGAEAVTSADGRLVAVGSDDAFPTRAEAWTSTDGGEWQPAMVISAPEGSAMTAATAIEGGFVAVGTETSPGGGGPDRIAAWHSADGLTWEPASVRKAARQGLGASVRHVAHGPGGLLALGQFFGQDVGPYRLYRSLDGQAWEPVALPKAKDTVWASLVSIPDGYLLIGNKLDGEPSTFGSADGEAWAKVGNAPRLLDAATGADGTIVAVSDQAIWTTQDLVTWEMVWQAPDPEATDGRPALDWVTWDGSRFAAAAISYEGCAPDIDECYQRWLLLSPDGTTWTESVGPDGLPGPDPSTWLADIASLGESTVVLGYTGPGPTVAWRMQPVPLTDPPAG